MANYDNITTTANTLWNSDSSGQIAYAEQIGDGLIDWNSPAKKYNGTYPNPENPSERLPYVPDTYKNKTDETGKNVSKFQASLNEFFLNHWADWLHFLYDEGITPGVIDSWKEVQDFLEGISDEEAMTLMKIIYDVQTASGQLNVRLSETYPGSLEALTSSEFMNITKSYLDPETGAITIIYTFD